METSERYEIRRKLGQGGAGAVYEGYDRQLRRRVAIKRLLQNGESETSSSTDDLLKECHSLSALNSPNIVRLFDFGTDSDGSFVVMELLDGHTLETLISRSPLSESDFFALAEQSLEGLLTAHKAHILHRDLKPGNFMVTWLPSGRIQIKLLDFGLAKFSVEPSKQTIAHGNSLLGSIFFMAPEQFERAPLDARTDLYSLGAVFYYALTGVYPFDGDSIAQVMAGHLSGQYRDLRELRPELPHPYALWVMNLMSRNPDHRPDSCATAMAQFENIRRGTYTPPEPIRPQASQSHTLQPPTQSYTLPTQTGTVRLVVPGAQQHTGPVRLNTGPIRLNTGSIPLSPHPSPLTGSIAAPSLHTSGIPTAPSHNPYPGRLTTPPTPPTPRSKKPLAIIASLGLLIALAFFLIQTLSPKNQTPPTNLNSPKPLPQKLPPAELIATLALPPDAETLMQRRDRNQDGKLTSDEFTLAPTRKQEEKLRDYFPVIDTNNDQFIDLDELNSAYSAPNSTVPNPTSPTKSQND